VGAPKTVRGRIGVYNHDNESEDMSLAMLHYPDRNVKLAKLTVQADEYEQIQCAG
jgi:hypothetical protein